jgi:PAS domain S-box-containing protein
MTATGNGWEALFASAFARSRNAMALVDADRRQVDVNGAYLRLLGYRRDEVIGRPIWSIVVGGPLLTAQEWRDELADGRATGTAELHRADGSPVGVQWAAIREQVTAGSLVLFVALSTSRWGVRFRRAEDADAARAGAQLSLREREIVGLVALGGTAAEIADDLHISHHTVRTHLRNAMEKLGARSRAQLVAKAIGHGLLLDDAPVEIAQPRYRKRDEPSPA